MATSNVAFSKYKIEPNTVQETLTLPLYGRAYCSRKWPNVFPDKLSEEVIERIDYDFEAMDATLKDFQTLTWGLRQRALADAASDYLCAHPSATIVDLGCGLSTARPRIDNGVCRFLNIDLPDVIEMRDALLPAGERERNLAHDAFDLSWCDEVEHPEDGVFVMSGGVLMYFTAEQNKALITGLAERFPNGGICFDAENEAGMNRSNKVVEKQGNTGAPIVFAVGDAVAELGPWSPNFAEIKVVDRLPDYLAKASEVALSSRAILGLGARMGMVKFVEIRFGYGSAGEGEGAEGMLQFGDVQETALVTLAIRASETARPDPRIRDEKAAEIIRELGVDVSKYDPFLSHEGVVARTIMFADALRTLIEQYPDAVCINLGCGFDDKFSQVDNGQIGWFDVDLPDQIAVRRKVFEDRPRCTMLDGDALDGAWTKSIPKDRSTVIVVMEGVLEYFTKEQAATCLHMLCDNFEHGWLLAEMNSMFIVKHSDKHDAIGDMDASFKWGTDSGDEFVELEGRLQLVDERSYNVEMRKHTVRGRLFADTVGKNLNNRLAVFCW